MNIFSSCENNHGKMRAAKVSQWQRRTDKKEDIFKHNFKQIMTIG